MLLIANPITLPIVGVTGQGAAFADGGSGKDGDGGDDNDGGDGGNGGHGGGQGSGGSGSGSGNPQDTGGTVSTSVEQTAPLAARSGLRIARVVVSSVGVEIEYTDGSVEEILNGRYAMRDPSGRAITSHPALGADVSRMRGIIATSAVTERKRDHDIVDTSSVTRAEHVQDRIEIEYANGWSEAVRGGRYELIDPFQRIVTQRPATDADTSRLLGIVGR